MTASSIFYNFGSARIVSKDAIPFAVDGVIDILQHHAWGVGVDPVLRVVGQRDRASPLQQQAVGSDEDVREVARRIQRYRAVVIDRAVEGHYQVITDVDGGTAGDIHWRSGSRAVQRAVRAIDLPEGRFPALLAKPARAICRLTG